MPQISRPPALATAIRQQRRKRNLSLDELARRSGVSKAMLSQIEGDKVNPTVLTVWKIARGLDMDINELLHAEEEGRFDVYRRDAAVMLEYDEGRCVIQVIAPHRFMEDQEIYLLRLKPGGSLVSEAHFPGTEELLTGLQGGLEVVSGSSKVLLNSGDSVHYRADIAHSISNNGDAEAVAYMLVAVKSRGSHN